MGSKRRVLAAKAAGVVLVDDLMCPDLTFCAGAHWLGGAVCLSVKGGFYCTRYARHSGRHAAGNGTRIIAVWGKRGRKGKR